MATYETVADQVLQSSVTAIRSSAISGFILANLEESDSGTPLLVKTRPELIDGTMPIGKGGTGIDELRGKRLIASNADGTSFEEVDVLLEYFSGLRTNIQDKLDTLRNFIVNLSTSEWVSDSNGYYKEIAVENITSADNPFIGLAIQSTTSSEVEKEKYAYSCIDNVTVNDGKVTFRCFDETPSMDISLIFVCM